jgi:peptide/nickel transport system ATP-binding protein
MSDGSILTVSNLTAEFRSEGVWRPAVKDLSFALGARETLAVVGESGSGKSVTALSLMRLMPRANGRIQGSAVLDGRNLLALSEEEMRSLRGNEIAMIFQEPMTSLNPVLTIGSQIAEALRYHRGLTGATAEAEVVRALDRVRIPSAAGRLRDFPHQFSGGMRQRVMIAMALACQPKVLIADEPTTALDVTVQEQILELIKALQTELGMAVIFITHDMGVVAEVADRTLVMWRGRKVEEGDTEAVFRAPRHSYARALLGSLPALHAMRGEAGPSRFPIFDTANGEPILVEPRPSATREPAPKAGPLLQVEHLSARFDQRVGVFGRLKGRVHAVEDVSFSVGMGETLSLVGESGCGKSTTARSILRLVEPSSGRVRFDGEDVLTLSRASLKRMRRRMQMIFQDPYASLNPRLTVGKAIAEPIIVHGAASHRNASDRVAELLRKVGLSPDVANRLPHEFSGGQRQRLCIARALSLGPEIVIADECVSALDVSIKAQVLNLLMDLQEEFGLAYLFISHDMAVVERISHRIAVMYLGEIVEIGPRAAIVEDPQHPYTRRLLAAVPVPDPSRRGQRAVPEPQELVSPLRAPDYEPPTREWREPSPGHFVRVDA